MIAPAKCYCWAPYGAMVCVSMMYVVHVLAGHTGVIVRESTITLGAVSFN